MTKVKDQGEPDAKALREEAARLETKDQASVLLAAADRLDTLSKILEDDRSTQRVWRGIAIVAGVGCVRATRLSVAGSVVHSSPGNRTRP